MKILITGGEGMLGSYFDFGTRLSKKDLDVTNLNEVQILLEKEKPEVVVHLAALTDMKKSEDDPTLSYMINSVGTYNVALAAERVGAKMIYISTNAVFDGQKKEPYEVGDNPNPINIYGHSKYLGEMAVIGVNPKNLVIRSSWIFGGGNGKDKKFVGKIAPMLLLNKEVSAVDDCLGTPTYGKDLASKVLELIEGGVSGLVHVANTGSASRFDMVKLMKEKLLSKSEIKGVPISTFGNIANTLKNECLESKGYILRPWQEALGEYLEKEWKN